MNLLADAQVDHFPMRADLLHEPNPLNDHVIELNQLFFGQAVEHGKDFGELWICLFGHAPDNAKTNGSCREKNLSRSADHEATGHHVVKCLLALSEARHDVADRKRE